ncbi:triacylglycerol lipase [Herminiimonas sp. CN]|uniref:esterase/lipase family protein n=1 Tax=Herminiimonas sp. CN TaxID=1349818 RepID=UPI00138E3F6E|nr:alpha/beta fold hydrolase [Herminiimonas sp. CN]
MVAGLCIVLHHYFLVASMPLAWILSFSALALVRFMLIANTFFIAYRYRGPLPTEQRLSWKTGGRLLFQEFWASMLVTSWQMPFCSFSGTVAPQAAGLPVLLIHGYGCNSGYWHSMRRHLIRSNISHKGIDLEPLLGGIDDYAASLNKAVEELCRESGKTQLIILAHSMGGLAARVYLHQYGSRRIAKIISVGTPHHGTMLAKFGIGINSQQMRWHGDADRGQPSDWLRNLASAEDTASRALITSIYSLHDNIVAPQQSCHLPGANNIGLPRIGHVALGLHPTVQALALAEIRLAARLGQL